MQTLLGHLAIRVLRSSPALSRLCTIVNNLYSPDYKPIHPFYDAYYLSSSKRTMKELGRGRKGKSHKGKPRMFRDNQVELSKMTIRRLARRGGIKRLAAQIYEEIERVVHSFLLKIVFDATQISNYTRRGYVATEDVLQALKQNGQKLYGFDPI